MIVNVDDFGSRVRNPDLPDYNDFIVVKVDRMKFQVDTREPEVFNRRSLLSDLWRSRRI